MTSKERPKIGLALGSGGARGWCHIGILRGLADIGIRPDVIAGASMGALVGAVFAGDALDALEDWAVALTARDFIGMLDIDLSSGGLVEGAEILTVLRRLIEPDRIEELSLPTAIVATDMATGREVWMTKGGVAEAVRASVALPGLISPFRIRNKWFLDGGLTNPLPVTACRLLGADVVIAANPDGRFNGTYWTDREGDHEIPTLVTSWKDHLPSMPSAIGKFFRAESDREQRPEYLDVVATSIDIMTDGIRRAKLAGDPPHVLLDAQLPQLSVLDFHRAEEAIEEGRRIVKDKSDEILRLLEDFATPLQPEA